MNERNTLETCPATTVLTIGAAPGLVKLVEEAARCVPTAEVVSCDLKAAPTRVAELWPFAIVINEDLYAFDSPEFEALARDVRAHLITVSAEPDAGFVDRLRQQLDHALRTRLA